MRLFAIDKEEWDGNQNTLMEKWEQPSLLVEVMETLNKNTESMTKCIERMTSGIQALKDETHVISGYS